MKKGGTAFSLFGGGGGSNGAPKTPAKTQIKKKAAPAKSNGRPKTRAELMKLPEKVFIVDIVEDQYDSVDDVLDGKAPNVDAGDAIQAQSVRTDVSRFGKPDNFRRFFDSDPKEGVTPKILTRIKELKLLSKAEKLGLLSAAENAGLSLTAIEKYGLLSKAEKFGVLSLVSDRSSPSKLTTLAAVCLAGSPALVYFAPEDINGPTFGLLAFTTVALAVAGSTALAGSTLIQSLQKTK